LEGLAPEALGGFVSGIETRDDAGYVPFGGGLLLQTADFLTPVVDDPFRFGQIAAANTFSNVYAMGGEPLTALKRDLVSEGEIEDAVQSAATLNSAARDAMRSVGVSAATDVTGYGFLGHLSEMLEAGGVGAVVGRGTVPVWERAVPLANAGVYPGGLKSTREYLRGRVERDGVGEEALLPLFDPQTSGGLLAAAPEGRARDLVRLLQGDGVSAAVVGEVVEGAGVRVTA